MPTEEGEQLIPTTAIPLLVPLMTTPLSLPAMPMSTPWIPISDSRAEYEVADGNRGRKEAPVVDVAVGNLGWKVTDEGWAISDKGTEALPG